MIPVTDTAAMSRLDVHGFRDELMGLYAELDEDIRRAGPVCHLSGLCCRFQEYGHTLFLSAPEAALLLADAPAPARPLDEGATCPWQDANGRCTARHARPLGCRTYFCDPAYQNVMPELTAAAITRLKALIDRLGLPWNYAPLHVHLRTAYPFAPGALARPGDPVAH
jgi:Fe-S-cluster containining protein